MIQEHRKTKIEAVPTSNEETTIERGEASMWACRQMRGSRDNQGICIMIARAGSTSSELCVCVVRQLTRERAATRIR